jgi:hypothetical protein
MIDREIPFADAVVRVHAACVLSGDVSDPVGFGVAWGNLVFRAPIPPGVIGGYHGSMHAVIAPQPRGSAVGPYRAEPGARLYLHYLLLVGPTRDTLADETVLVVGYASETGELPEAVCTWLATLRWEDEAAAFIPTS